jgi:MtN3 and saliva related transmembrane protein
MLCYISIHRMDPNVSPTMNILLIIANVINVVYNIPQIIHTYRTKSTKDFNTWFIVLRIVGNAIWVVYAVDINSTLMIINNVITVASSVFIAYYKFNDCYGNPTIIPEELGDIATN